MSDYVLQKEYQSDPIKNAVFSKLHGTKRGTGLSERRLEHLQSVISLIGYHLCRMLCVRRRKNGAFHMHVRVKSDLRRALQGLTMVQFKTILFTSPFCRAPSAPARTRAQARRTSVRKRRRRQDVSTWQVPQALPAGHLLGSFCQRAPLFPKASCEQMVCSRDRFEARLSF